MNLCLCLSVCLSLSLSRSLHTRPPPFFVVVFYSKNFKNCNNLNYKCNDDNGGSNTNDRIYELKTDPILRSVWGRGTSRKAPQLERPNSREKLLLYSTSSDN